MHITQELDFLFIIQPREHMVPVLIVCLQALLK